MGQDECDRYMWHKRPITFVLDNNTRVIAMCDDEGNDGGVLWYGTKDNEGVLPVLRGED